MLILLPALAYTLFFLVLRKKGVEWRSACLAAAVFSGTCLVLITEILSLPRLLYRGSVAASWAVVCLLVLLYFWKMSAPVTRNRPDSGRLESSLKALLLALGILVGVVGLLALVSAPNVWDAMEYHLPRATMWISNHSVRFYPTPDYAQLIYGPWAEFAMMHTELLWGSDRLVNIVQFLSFVFSAIAVSVIARSLGAGIRGQILAAVLSITISEGILEASGPMNTYAVAFWITATVTFLLLWNEDRSWLNIACVGLSAGLAIGTKGSAYIILPFLVFACWWIGSPTARIQFLKRTAIVLLLIFAVNGAHYFRTYELTGSPLGFPLPSKYPRLQVVVDHVSIGGTAAGILRNASIHVVTPSERINTTIDHGFQSAIWKLGVDPNNRGQIYLNDPFHSNHFSLHEIHAGNPLHFFLIVVAMGVAIWKGYRRRDPAFWFAIGLLGSLVFFSALLRWTVWSSRYQLPFFVVGAALVGFVLDRYVSRRPALVLAWTLIICAVPFVLLNRTRSFIPWSRVENIYHPRSYQYFLDSHAAIAPANIVAAQFVDRLPCNRVAIDVYLDKPVLDYTPRSMYVYPLLAQIHADGIHRSVWYAGVQNDTNRFATAQRPCAVICLDCANMRQKWQEYQSVGGRASVFDYIVVFSAQGEIRNSGVSDAVATSSPLPRG